MRTLILFSLPLLLLSLTSASQALTLYPDTTGASVMFSGLQEETNTAGDPQALYGAPTVVGDALLFTPSNFVSASSGGASDQTMGTFQGLITKLDPQTGGLDILMLTESGDFGLDGVGSSATNASVVAGMFIRILQVNVDGALMDDIILANDTSSFGVDSPSQSGTWTTTTTIEVLKAVQDKHGPNAFATVVSFTFDNALSSNSEVGTNAFIQKKDAFVTLQVIPEPTTATLLALGLLALASTRKRAA